MTEEQGVTPESTELVLTPISQVEPDDVGTLELTYTDGVPVLKLSGGSAAPAALRVVDDSGNTIAAYTAAAVAKDGISVEPLSPEEGTGVTIGSRALTVNTNVTSLNVQK
ncbi:hypothetical protein AB0H00_28980 [Nocardia sp. NPDC023852]|uniref:hypothetical protein n=1 Tax=Nocardia sp. NPDC023852 TaxID=3154697 RepID=UPI0033FDC2D3